MKKKSIKEYLFSLTVTTLIIMLGASIPMYLCKKDQLNLEASAQKLSPENATLQGFMPLYEIIKFKRREISILSRNEVENKKPQSLWEWGTIEDLKNNTNIDFTQNNYFFVFTKNNQNNKNNE